MSAPASSLPSPRQDAPRIAAWAAALVVLALGMLFAARRLAGVINEDLDLIRFLITAIVAAVSIFVTRAGWIDALSTASRSEKFALGWCGSIALSLLCLSCIPPSLHSAAWLAWCPLVALDHLSRRNFFAIPPASRGTGTLAKQGSFLGPKKDSSSRNSIGLPPASNLNEGDDQENADGEVLQQLTRLRTADGRESIRGALRADFAAGQRHATLHISFCPPLEGPPDIELELADGPDAVAKVAQAYPHGARIEVRLAEPAEEPCHAIVEVVASPSGI